MTKSVCLRPDLISSPMELFLSLPQNIKNLCFLTSDGSESSRWSILAWHPDHILSYNGSQVFLDNEIQNQSLKQTIHTLHKKRKRDEKYDIPFIGGGIGAIDYEYGYELLDLPYKHDGSSLVEYLFFDNALVYDHQKNTWYEVGNCQLSPTPVGMRRGGSLQEVQTDLEPQWDKQSYVDHFQTIHENIRLGEIYQACLTFPFKTNPFEDPREAFAQMYLQNPSPMASYLELPSRTILSLSPERFFHWDGNRMETKPIKGTRKRSSNPVEDKNAQEELLSDQKEQAELSMITDLLRNDLSKISKSGSVQVLQHRSLQKLPKVWHTYSHIQSETKEGIQPWDIIEAMFPGGSISGCPKRRAVKLLADVEDYRRGIYTGSIGYLSDDGKMDQSIVIRTMEQFHDTLQCSFGGGIVFDSTPESEYEECFAKSQTFSCSPVHPPQSGQASQRTEIG
ncbi:MAG: anthranilate synthase component I family protein [Candidatus Gracilibacteria bacterium]|nr:anthranilate synthase component I family protein [Candidatus Gracilibacteria bacterium]